ncbi:hypothetical protein Pla52n_70770 [Stieleria varia]|uniref:Uncharacterized protein n=1 Tax=Stieleria varia TaxID=2528005 RepID=A0A5C5ZGJ5_9BACT|nr:hypothetical protein Pla52n_70770 [Stieleria varia]
MSSPIRVRPSFSSSDKSIRTCFRSKLSGNRSLRFRLRGLGFDLPVLLFSSHACSIPSRASAACSGVANSNLSWSTSSKRSLWRPNRRRIRASSWSRDLRSSSLIASFFLISFCFSSPSLATSSSSSLASLANFSFCSRRTAFCRSSCSIRFMQPKVTMWRKSARANRPKQQKKSKFSWPQSDRLKTCSCE